MGALDHQLGIVDEATYGTSVTVTKFYEYNSADVDVPVGRTESAPLIKGNLFKRSDRFFPYVQGGTATVSLDVMTKGMAYWFKHMFGAAPNTSGPAETSVYTHTSVEGTSLIGAAGGSFTLQVNKMFHPSGTAQAYTLAGCKITDWELKNTVDDNLSLDLTVDAQNVSTAVGLATASYPTAMYPLTWAGGTLTIAATSVPITEISVKVSNNLAVDRRFISGSTLKKEPTPGYRECTWSIKCDFDSLTQYNRVVSATRAGAVAAISGTWNHDILLGTTLYPSLKVDIAAARFDDIKWDGGDASGMTSQELSGVGVFDSTNNTVKLTYQTADVTP